MVGVVPAHAEPRWQWPLAPPHDVVHPFEAPPHRYGPGHRGVDLVGTGTTVTAVEGGTVRFAGPVAGRGVVSIEHADGLVSTYEPVTAQVTGGDRVVTGQVIGELEAEGPSHCGDRICLHLGARRGLDYQDPEPLLRGAEPSVLLPLRPGDAPAGESSGVVRR
jgi:murein DD-endopeptidase MepM/ murein hydrolase activator NlpD